MANIGSKGILRHIDDPSVTVIADAVGAGVTWMSDADGSDTNFLKAVEVGKGLHYKGVLAATNDNKIEFAGNNLQFTAQEGHSAIELMVQFSSMADIGFSFGFNDEVEDSSGNMPMTNVSTTIAANSAAFVGLIYDDDSDDPDNLYCVWVNGGTVGQTDSTGKIAGKYIKMDGMVPTAAKWFYMKVEIQDRGSGNGARATFLAIDHNGRSVEKTFNTSITRSTPLCFHFAAQNKDATGRNIFIRCPNWEQSIPDM